MRVGVRRRNGWWISMGPLGWFLFGWLYLAVLIGAGIGWVVYQVLRFAWLTLVELAYLVRRA